MKQILKSAYQNTASLPQISAVFWSIKFQDEKTKPKNNFSSVNCNVLKFHLNAALLKKQNQMSYRITGGSLGTLKVLWGIVYRYRENITKYKKSIPLYLIHILS